MTMIKIKLAFRTIYRRHINRIIALIYS